jgi:hypothetical protein
MNDPILKLKRCTKKIKPQHIKNGYPAFILKIYTYNYMHVMLKTDVDIQYVNIYVNGINNMNYLISDSEEKEIIEKILKLTEHNIVYINNIIFKPNSIVYADIYYKNILLSKVINKIVKDKL